MAACDGFPCGNDTCPATLQCLWQGNNGGAGILPGVIYSAEALVGAISLAMLIYAGFRLLTSQGDKKVIDTANKTIFFAAVGLFLVLFSFFILNIIGIATGVTCLEPINVLQNGFNACQ